MVYRTMKYIINHYTLIYFLSYRKDRWLLRLSWTSGVVYISDLCQFENHVVAKNPRKKFELSVSTDS